MELHSYAKHRTVKKWSIEQKKRLVEARINCEELFKVKPKTSLLPWNKVIFLAKLDDFNAVFVRKQWANMVAKYMQYKKDRLGNKPTHDIDAETVKKITQEWEFFQPIHSYMTRKTTNLHSYALTTQQEKVHSATEDLEHLVRSPRFSEDLNMKTQPPHQASASSNERLNVCSSDTNEDFAISMLPSRALPNTDHDFYSKKVDQHCYFADIEEDTLESMTMDVTTTTPLVCGIDIEHTQEFEVKDETQYCESKSNVPNVGSQEIVQTVLKQENTVENNEFATGSKNRSSSTILSERDKYYRHKRRFNHRMERRFNAILNVVGQIAKSEYPSIDISPLVQAGCGIINGVLSSSSCEDEETDNEDGIRTG